MARAPDVTPMMSDNDADTNNGVIHDENRTKHPASSGTQRFPVSIRLDERGRFLSSKNQTI